MEGLDSPLLVSRDTMRSSSLRGSYNSTKEITLPTLTPRSVKANMTISILTFSTKTLVAPLKQMTLITMFSMITLYPYVISSVQILFLSKLSKNLVIRQMGHVLNYLLQNSLVTNIGFVSMMAWNGLKLQTLLSGKK